jgi:hypothetical protein
MSDSSLPLVPAIRRDNTLICPGGIDYDCIERFEIFFNTFSYRDIFATLRHPIVR